MPNSKGPVFDYFPESRIQLGRELHHHPEVMQQIQEAGVGDDYPQLLGVVAAHFNVLMDGMYTQDDLNILAEKLVFKLRAKRAGLKVTMPVGNPIDTYGQELITDVTPKQH